MRLYKVVILVNIALGLGLLSGFLWWQQDVERLTRELAVAKQRAAAPEAGERSWTLQGIVRGVAPGTTLIVTHEEIPGLMPAMTMSYRADSLNLLRGLSPGDRVQFTLKKTKDQLLVVAVQKEKQ